MANTIVIFERLRQSYSFSRSQKFGLFDLTLLSRRCLRYGFRDAHLSIFALRWIGAQRCRASVDDLERRFSSGKRNISFFLFFSFFFFSVSNSTTISFWTFVCPVHMRRWCSLFACSLFADRCGRRVWSYFRRRRVSSYLDVDVFGRIFDVGVFGRISDVGVDVSV